MWRRPAALEGCDERRWVWVIFVGFVAGMVARFLAPGPNKPAGFALTTVLGIAAAILATFIGQSVGWYRPNQGAGFIAAIAGAFVVLFVWNRLVVNGTIGDPRHSALRSARTPRFRPRPRRLRPWRR